MRLYPRQKRSPSVTIILAFMSIQAAAAAAVQSQDHPSPKKSVTRKKEEEWSSLFQFRGNKRLDKQACVALELFEMAKFVVSIIMSILYSCRGQTQTGSYSLSTAAEVAFLLPASIEASFSLEIPQRAPFKEHL